MLSKFVGIPYVAHGRDYDGADCWGLVYLYYRDLLGTPIPSYSVEMHEREFHRRDIGPLIDAEKEKRWLQADAPSPGDCVLLRAGRYNSHVGIFLGAGKILHSEGPEPSVVARLDDMRLRSRITGYFRLKTDGLPSA
ncbi:NlpC/P60 family protein [Rhizobium sp. BE258]|uniref:C40 family peptidase n=1 Tax=Rhizobium sp. BE258 TaxID=2817722 RepID=UPI00286BE592|nr:NlpC/P60 family protein [Rhizobium sp. BE258]